MCTMSDTNCDRYIYTKSNPDGLVLILFFYFIKHDLQIVLVQTLSKQSDYKRDLSRGSSLSKPFHSLYGVSWIPHQQRLHGEEMGPYESV